MTKQTSSQQAIEKMLESDDEFPSSCDEGPSISAYMDDNRFDELEFKWIFQPQMLCNNKVVSNEASATTSNQSHNINNIPEINPILRGYLRKRDILCLKCVTKNFGDGMFLWFVKFLVHKDLQSKYTENFRSCLVSSYPQNDYEIDSSKNIKYESSARRYKIVVKD